MSGLRFNSEADYQRFLDSYQRRKKGTKAPILAPISPQNTPKAVDKTVTLLKAIVAAGLPGVWYREFTFHEARNWRLDVACPACPESGRKIGVEIDGGIHRIKGKFLRDMEKHNALTLAGFRWLRVTPAQVDSGEALVLLEALIREGR